MAPQIIEMIAPIKNATAVYAPYYVRNRITKNITATNIKQIRYSCFKNSMAPYVMMDNYIRNFFAQLN